MRRIVDILSDAAEGNVPNHEECYWALLALRGKLHFVFQDLQKIAEAYEKQNPMQLEISLRMRAGSAEKIFSDRQKFQLMDPKKWLGDSGNPFTEENKQFKDMADMILKKALKKD